MIDAGMMYLGYDSDISRTYALDTANPVFKSLISSVDKMQQELVSQVSIELDMVDLNKKAYLGIAQVLKEHEIISILPEEAIEKNIIKYFMPHSIGHLLGLQTHDVGFTKTSTTLKEGFVTTVEPGIYFNSLLLDSLKSKEEGGVVNWSLVDELIPFGGIRIEDNIHVTKNGPKNLTRAAFDTMSS
jgi:Xaa-Pro dipeptidase